MINVISEQNPLRAGMVKRRIKPIDKGLVITKIQKQVYDSMVIQPKDTDPFDY